MSPYAKQPKYLWKSKMCFFINYLYIFIYSLYNYIIIYICIHILFIHVDTLFIIIYIYIYIYIYIHIHMVVFKIKNKHIQRFDYCLLQDSRSYRVTFENFWFTFYTKLFTVSWCVCIYIKESSYKKERRWLMQK